MGNQLTGIAPSQILPVEHYLQDVPEFEFVSSLGSTRFFKVAKARCSEGTVVVKVFVIHDPSLPLKSYRVKLEEMAQCFVNASNLLPFQEAIMSDKAAILFRQYVKDSLYDRISTRPFLSAVEKKFLAFQLLCALNQCHKYNICHGDIKSENVMITSWNWLLLADFANFKPTYLPEDNPADFSYFFDTSRRRTCYIAPERFVVYSSATLDASKEQSNLDLPTANSIQKGDLLPAMDIFSAGCVITELFTEGSVPFDLASLLAYKSQDVIFPSDLIQTIDDIYIRDLVRHMMQRDPELRSTAEEYLHQQRGKAFPEYFYSFLKYYLQRFVTTPILSPDDRVARVSQDLHHIYIEIGVNKNDPEENSCLVHIISVITSSIRDLIFLKSKLTALDILLQLAQLVTDDIVLERIIPYMLFLVNDSYSQVRSEVIRKITICLSQIRMVPLSEANIFPEYILPQMAHLPQDSSTSVRVTYAENIAVLSETAARFLEIVQLHSQPLVISADSVQESESIFKVTYDIELEALHEMIQKKVVSLLSDPENIVKQTLLENGITRLCVFFGRQKANDILLSHMITFLNNKDDWHLRGAFFDAIVGVASYVGWHSSNILKPILQQGLSDAEEFVIHKTLVALQSMVEVSLLQKPMIYEIMNDIKCFLCHPNTWIRQGTVGYICALARTLNIADVHCHVIPAIRPFLKQNILQVEKELVLLHCLSEPINRQIYDYVLRSQNIERLFNTLEKRQCIRQMCRSGHVPSYPELDNTMLTMFRKLQSEGMEMDDENKLLAMRDFMIKLHKTRASSCEPGKESPIEKKDGTIYLYSLPDVKKRRADLLKLADPNLELNIVVKKPQFKKKTGAMDSPTAVMNEDWKQMFGSNDIDRSTIRNMRNTTSITSLETITEGVTSLNMKQEQNLSFGSSVLPSVLKSQNAAVSKGTPTILTRYAPCKLDLRRLVHHKKSLFCEHQVDELDNTTWESRPPPANWKPKGLLVAHLHEHRGAVNRLKINHNQSYFATCSNDGTVKVFDAHRMQGKSVTNRARLTYDRVDGQVKTLAFCDNSQSIAFVADKGDSAQLKVFRLELGSDQKYKSNDVHNYKLNVQDDGMVVDMIHFDTGSQNVLSYATVNGLMIGWDLRSGKEVWRLQNNLKQGLITSFDIHPKLNWMVLGTSNGTMACWDMRFQLAITSVTHPTGARVRKVLVHPTADSTVITSVQGNNEVSFWDLETGCRQKTLWASNAPALSQTQATAHSTHASYYGTTDSNTFLLTAGSDRRIRYWDLSYPSNSQLLVGAATDPVNNQTAVSYRSRLIDGTEVIQETYSKQKSFNEEDSPATKGPSLPPIGHHDIITDINICQPNQCFMITTSRDGVIKVWK